MEKLTFCEDCKSFTRWTQEEQVILNIPSKYECTEKRTTVIENTWLSKKEVSRDPAEINWDNKCKWFKNKKEPKNE